MNAIVAVGAAIRREGEPDLANHIAPMFADHGHDSPAGNLARYGFALLRSALSFDPGFRFEDDFAKFVQLLPDRRVDALADAVVAEDSERFFAAADLRQKTAA